MPTHFSVVYSSGIGPDGLLWVDRDETVVHESYRWVHITADGEWKTGYMSREDFCSFVAEQAQQCKELDAHAQQSLSATEALLEQLEGKMRK